MVGVGDVDGDDIVARMGSSEGFGVCPEKRRPSRGMWATMAWTRDMKADSVCGIGVEVDGDVGGSAGSTVTPSKKFKPISISLARSIRIQSGSE